MRIITGGKGTGKTKELIKLSLDSGAPILCMSDAEQDKIIKKSVDHFGRICETCTIPTMSQYESVLVRDIDYCLNHLLEIHYNTTLAGGTLTTDN